MKTDMLNTIVLALRALCVVPLAVILGYLWRHRKINGLLGAVRKIIASWSVAVILVFVLTIAMRLRDIADGHMAETHADEWASIAASLAVLFAGTYSLKLYRKIYRRIVESENNQKSV